MKKRTTINDPEYEDAWIRDPAHAAAAGKCWVSRMMGGKVGSAVADHRGTCSWCGFTPDFIVGRLAEFQEWAGLIPPDRHDPDDPLVRVMRSEVERFAQLPASEQLRLVREAQDIEVAAMVTAVEEPERLSDVYR